MGRNSIESIIEDFVRGAREGGFKGNIVVSRDNHGHEEKLASLSEFRTLPMAMEAGYKAAFAQLLAPLAGALAGPAARAALPAIGKRVGTGLGSMAFDTVAGQAAASGLDRLTRPRQQVP